MTLLAYYNPSIYGSMDPLEWYLTLITVLTFLYAAIRSTFSFIPLFLNFVDGTLRQEHIHHLKVFAVHFPLFLLSVLTLYLMAQGS